ncbi:unnamed protein product [Euphydryas editha]|uniref:Uncharacterized protein n=1 Tax=Euphydryas editha TaxID=104508 RepID=A0AAU9V025_EUPED|nr:unnamed protein product [Euphydryas editha]
MAYNLSERFSKAKQSYRILDPGSYQNTNHLLIKPNNVPFLSKAPRSTLTSAKIWTHAIYYSDIKPKIPNCTTIASKIPRFTYENKSDDDIPPLICQCGMQRNICECAIEELKTDHQDDIVCQSAVRRRIFKGPTPRSIQREGHSTPFKEDYGSQILPNGSKRHMVKQTKEDCPPFYDVKVLESNAYYRGCKWSRWTSQRCNNTVLNSEVPGPADYFIDGNQPSYDYICGEKLRALKRKTAKQLRFIEKAQRHNILEGLPGPASYNPVLPKGTNLKYFGPNAERFISPKYHESPKPTTYFIKRDFDIIQSDFTPCLAKLPSRAAFGVKDSRFKYKRVVGPSPCSYNVNQFSCHMKHNNRAPFGSCSKRFTDIFEKDTQNCDDNNDIENDKENKSYIAKRRPTWQFRSKTIRMKPLIKMVNISKAADTPLREDFTNKRLLQFQYICPFFSSEARFRNWFNWIPVQGSEKTPGPGFYKPERVKCLPAVKSGPISRSKRFASYVSDVPAPNTYEMQKGLEDILTTCNQRLKNNVENKHTYIWKGPVEQRKLTLEEQEIKLLNKSIALLDVPDVFEFRKYENKEGAPPLKQSKTDQTKLLRCFLYANKVKRYF